LKINQGRWLDAPGLTLVLLGVTSLDWCWRRGFLESVLRVIYRKDASMSHEYQRNAWGVQSDMMHTCAQITHTNLY
jgi:hypothetical protein